MKVLEGGLRTAFLIFFISHIPITILVDGQAVFSRLYPSSFLNLVAWYSDLFGDVLMRRSTDNNKDWFASLVLCELLFQIPFFFVAARMILSYPTKTVQQEAQSSNRSTKNGNTKQRFVHDEDYPSWFRSTCIIYGAHTSTTLVPILATFAMSQEMTISQKVSTILGKLLQERYPENQVPL
jgi:hypothetical protein